MAQGQRRSLALGSLDEFRREIVRIEEAIAEVFVKMGRNKLPLLPARQTMHLMAKAAVAVYEAAVENRLAKD
jgi:hypothetical protein